MKRSSQKLPALVIHAGAGRVVASEAAASRMRESLRRILHETYERLKQKSALDAALWAVEQLENDPQFNAGTGGQLQSDGAARLTAAVMDGETGRFAGVVNVELVKNPIRVAQQLFKEKDRVLAGEGAREYARKLGFQSYNPVTEERWKEWKRKVAKPQSASQELCGTVGAVAVDIHGRVASATSTGGKGMEIVGRVSDSGTVAGTFASKKAAVSATGIGEEIVESALAVRIVTRVDDGKSLSQAFAKSFKELRKSSGRAGAIGVDYKGAVEVRTTTPRILHAGRTPHDEFGYP